MRENYDVCSCSTVKKAISLIKSDDFDLVILDLMLSDGDGSDVLLFIRGQNKKTPVIILSAKNSSQDKIKGLSAGVDDYLTKPFVLEELLLRMKNLLRRSFDEPEEKDLFEFSRNKIYLREGRCVTAKGEIFLTEIESKLLAYFISNPGRIIDRSELLSEVWGVGASIRTRTVDIFVSRFRKYFEEDAKLPLHFKGHRGQGYSFHP